jgi:hypothetical protein
MLGLLENLPLGLQFFVNWQRESETQRLRGISRTHRKGALRRRAWELERIKDELKEMRQNSRYPSTFSGNESVNVLPWP